MTNKEIEKVLGKQVTAGKPLTCPLCTEWKIKCGGKGEHQPMMSDGEYPHILFCPHCCLGVRLKVFYNPDEQDNAGDF